MGAPADSTQLTGQEEGDHQLSRLRPSAELARREAEAPSVLSRREIIFLRGL
jgi:hypothetical protein